MSNPRRLVQLLLVLGVICVTVAGQTGSSNISGTVKDVNGAVVPGALVTAKNEATGVTSTQTTTDAGLYAFLPCRWVITPSPLRSRVQTLQSTGNPLQVGQPLTVDAARDWRSVGDGHRHRRSPTTTDCQRHDRKRGRAEGDRGPATNGRNPLTLLLLEPGVVQRSWRRRSGVHVNGSRDRAYNVTIAGLKPANLQFQSGE